jgi:hypothetical protein
MHGIMVKAFSQGTYEGRMQKCKYDRSFHPTRFKV